MAGSVLSVLVLCLTCVSGAVSGAVSGGCEVRARTTAGWVCGLHRVFGRTPYASFLGVPYAEQPVGHLRFKELQPLKSWDVNNDGKYIYDATREGPVCPQHDVLYGSLMTIRNMSEACIHANIHVPIKSLPGYKLGAPGFQSPYRTGRVEDTGLPILVFVHGGGFAFGSGDTDMHGPEYLMKKDVIVITFNYRLNVFGFLSLDSPTVPGNNGLRDVVTLLRWVKENAQYFGGDPNDITLAGQSAGAAITGLLTLSTAAEGLFQKAILMSGTAIPSFYTTSPIYAKFIANIFLTTLGINETDPDEVHRQLITLPLENIMKANQIVQDLIGITAFLPVVESPHEGVETILDEDPETLLYKGRGSKIPHFIGFTSSECETFRPNFEKLDILARIKSNPVILLSPNIIYKTLPNVSTELAKEVERRYFKGEPNMDRYLQLCSDTYYVYPAIKLAQIRAQTGAPAYLYQFSYDSDRSVIKLSKGLKFKGAGHIEDFTYIFRVNSFLNNTIPPTTSQDIITEWMTTFFKNFIYCDNPICKQDQVRSSSIQPAWPTVMEQPLQYLDIKSPKHLWLTQLTPEQKNMVKFFDHLLPQNI